MHHIAIQRRRRTIVGEQRDLSRSLASLVKCLNRLAPRRSLIVIDLAQIQHMPLHRATTADAPVFHDTPVAMFLAVLPADLAAQKHAARLPNPTAVSQPTWSAPQPIPANRPGPCLRSSTTYPRRP